MMTLATLEVGQVWKHIGGRLETHLPEFDYHFVYDCPGSGLLVRILAVDEQRRRVRVDYPEHPHHSPVWYQDHGGGVLNHYELLS